MSNNSEQYSELKRLAEAIETKDWHFYTPGGGATNPMRAAFLVGPRQEYMDRSQGFAEADAAFIAAANPAAVLALIAENERLSEAHRKVCTNYNQVSYASEERGKKIEELKAELEHTGHDQDQLRNEYDRLKAEVEGLREALNEIARQIEGNTRCLIRELVNRASGLSNGAHPNDLYDDCDRIDAIIDSALAKERAE